MLTLYQYVHYITVWLLARRCGIFRWIKSCIDFCSIASLPHVSSTIIIPEDFIKLDGEELIGHNWYFETDLLDLVRDLLWDLRSHSPALRQIILWHLVCSLVDQDTFKKGWHEVQVECALAGVDLQVMYDWLSPGLWAQNSHCTEWIVWDFIFILYFYELHKSKPCR